MKIQSNGKFQTSDDLRCGGRKGLFGGSVGGLPTRQFKTAKTHNFAADEESKCCPVKIPPFS
jgi:hypothetical protein